MERDHQYWHITMAGIIVGVALVAAMLVSAVRNPGHIEEQYIALKSEVGMWPAGR